MRHRHLFLRLLSAAELRGYSGATNGLDASTPQRCLQGLRLSNKSDAEQASVETGRNLSPGCV
jgi:hypothetical protein